MELLIARYRRDDLDLGRRWPKSPELEAPAASLVDDPRMVRRYLAQSVDLVVVLPIGEGSDFGEQGFKRPARHRIREAHQAIVKAE